MKDGFSSDITHKGEVIFVEDTNISNQTYNSSEDDVHVVMVTRGSVTLSDTVISKSGNTQGDYSDSYGTNSAVFLSGGSLELNNVDISTDGSNADAIFISSDKGVIKISDSVVITNGTLSEAVRSDSGGTIYIDGGKYTTNGKESPVIYSKGNVGVDNVELISNQSESVIVEGNGKLVILNSNLDNSNRLNGESDIRGNIFLHGTTSDAVASETAGFAAKDSTILTRKSDTIFLVDTNAEILLENNEIENVDNIFLKVGKGEGSNGCNVNLNLVNQHIEGDIIVDGSCSLNMNFANGSTFLGSINTDNQSQNISVSMDENSTWILNSDSYLSNLESDVQGYENINLNGYSLYLGNEEISSKDDLFQESKGITTVELSRDEGYSFSMGILGIGIVSVLFVVGIVLLCFLRRN